MKRKPAPRSTKSISAKKYKEMDVFFETLGIPVFFGMIDSEELFNILNDPEKCKEIVCKLKNRAFW